MADIQLEHGFTRIADVLLEAMCRAPVPGRHQRVFTALIRLTYGYNKTSDRIATSQISRLTDIDRRSITRILQDLEDAGMIERGALEDRTGGQPDYFTAQPFRENGGAHLVNNGKLSSVELVDTGDGPFDVIDVREGVTGPR